MKKWNSRWSRAVRCRESGMESGGSCLAEGDARGAAGKVEWNAVGSRRGRWWSDGGGVCCGGQAALSTAFPEGLLGTVARLTLLLPFTFGVSVYVPGQNRRYTGPA